jgi:hypothetical protein
MVAGFLGPEVLPVSKWLNTIGLVFGVVGVVLIFIWGPPQPSFEGDSLLLESTNEAALAAKKTHYKRMSRIGLALIGLGFVLQLWGVWA